MSQSKEERDSHWNKLLTDKRIALHSGTDAVQRELIEHYSFVKLMWMQVILPMIVLYVIMGLVLHVTIFGSLFMSCLVFIYSNMLPDADLLITRPSEGQHESLWYETFILLCFAPLVAYYAYLGKANPLYSHTSRPFHTVKTALKWAIFLFIVASLFWPNSLLQRLMFPLFGFIGYMFHLTVDGIVKFKFPVW